jgi:hypothetical protein
MYSLYTYSEHVNQLKLLQCPITPSKLCINTLIFNVLALLKVVELLAYTKYWIYINVVPYEHIQLYELICYWHTGVLRKRFPHENENTFRSRASEVLKRSSGLKGGDAYKAKKTISPIVPSTSNSTREGARKGKKRNSGSSSDDADADRPHKKTRTSSSTDSE